MNLNSNDPLRDRGVEILLYKRRKINSFPKEKKFNFKKIIPFFNKRINVNFEISFVDKASIGE